MRLRLKNWLWFLVAQARYYVDPGFRREVKYWRDRIEREFWLGLDGTGFSYDDSYTCTCSWTFPEGDAVFNLCKGCEKSEADMGYYRWH